MLVKFKGAVLLCKLVAVGARLDALSKQGGNSGQGFFAAAGNDDHFLNLNVVDGAADKSGEGEIQEFCSTFEFQFFIFRYTELDDVRFVVRRVVMLGIARGRLNIRFGHCTSCLFDNSSVKLCKTRHAVPFVPQGTNDEQGLGQARPNKITSEMQTHCRSEVPVEHNVFKN